MDRRIIANSTSTFSRLIRHVVRVTTTAIIVELIGDPSAMEGKRRARSAKVMTSQRRNKDATRYDRMADHATNVTVYGGDFCVRFKE